MERAAPLPSRTSPSFRDEAYGRRTRQDGSTHHGKFFSIFKKLWFPVFEFSLFIQGEVETLLQNVAKRKAEPMELGSYLSTATSNVICSLLMSVKFRHNDPRFTRFTSLIEDGFKHFTNVAMAGFIPILKLLPRFTFAFNQIRQVTFTS